MAIDINTILSVLSDVNYLDLPIILIFIYHILEFRLAFKFRSTKFYRSTMFAYCILFILSGSEIEKYCKSNFEKLYFSNDYFDQNGIFLFIFFQLPEIIIGIYLFIHLLQDYYEVYKSRKASQNNQKAKTN